MFQPYLTTVNSSAEIAQLGERQTEDLKVPGSIPGFGISFVFLLSFLSPLSIVFFKTFYEKSPCL